MIRRRSASGQTRRHGSDTRKVRGCDDADDSRHARSAVNTD
jgi:hypothetical protein